MHMMMNMILIGHAVGHDAEHDERDNDAAAQMSILMNTLHQIYPKLVLSMCGEE